MQNKTMPIRDRIKMKKKKVLLLGSALILLAGIVVFQVFRGAWEKPNVILISIDTLRPDVLGCYNKNSSLTPNIDRLAGQGVVFENAVSVAPWTIPAHMSMFTGLYPSEHRMNTFNLTPDVFKKQKPLSPDIRTLGEIFKEQGYSCVAFAGGTFALGVWGYARGFDLYDDSCKDIKNGVEKLIPWLREHKRDRFFVFLHTYVMHAPYAASRSIGKFSDQNKHDAFLKKYEELKQVGFTRDQADLGEVGARELFSFYKDSAIYLDHYIGVLMDHLRENGLLKNTVILFLSDHGEEFYEHRSFLHGHTLYKELLDIPMILYAPRSLSRNKRCPWLVSNIDVFSTLCSIAGAKDHTSGISLFETLSGARRRNFAFSEMSLAMGLDLKALTTERSKLIFADPPGKYPFPWKENSQPWQFYDLPSDPREQLNDPGLNTPVFLQLKELMGKITAKDGFHKIRRLETSPETSGMGTFFSFWTEVMTYVRSVFFKKRPKAPPVEAADFQLDEDKAQELKSLGYL